MEEKIIIKDSKRNPQVVIDSAHPFYNDIKNSLMPDEYRIEQRKISNLPDSFIEECIKNYYKQIEAPYGDNEISKKAKIAIFFPLLPIGILIN